MARMRDRFDPTFDLTVEPDDGDGAGTRSASKPAPVRRIEVFTTKGRRREWSLEAKARIVIESLEPGVVVSEVARRHGINPQQLFGWRSQVRELMMEDPHAPSVQAPSAAAPVAPALPGLQGPMFAAVVIKAAYASSRKMEDAKAPVATSSLVPVRPSNDPLPAGASAIEITIGAATVRLRGAVDARTLTAVLKALKGAS